MKKLYFILGNQIYQILLIGVYSNCIENAVTTIANDNSVEVEPVVDRDTQGVAGAPDIASTIFAKITASDVFIADVSIIAHPKMEDLYQIQMFLLS